MTNRGALPRLTPSSSMRRWMSFQLLVAVAMVPALPAQRVVFVNIGGGVSVPQGQLESGRDIGWHAMGALTLTSLAMPVALRLEGDFNQFTRSSDAPASVGDQSTLAITLNATYRLPMVSSPISPYIITGAGAYRTSCDDAAPCGTDTGFGWNAGAGFRFATIGLRGFVESRYHATGSGVARFIPVTVALTF
jgi:hypothetical protein